MFGKHLESFLEVFSKHSERIGGCLERVWGTFGEHLGIVKVERSVNVLKAFSERLGSMLRDSIW